MINKNKKYEGVIAVIIILILFSFCGVYVLNLINGQKFNTMRDNVYNIGNSVKSYATSMGDNYKIYSLEELNDLGVVEEVINPFDKSEECSSTFSKVTVDNEEVFVTLTCGNYIINNTYYKNNDISVYSVGEWSDINTIDDLDMMLGYNYKVNDVVIFDDYYERDIFIYIFNKHNKTNYTDISEIQSLYDVVSKNQYRTMEEVFEK